MSRSLWSTASCWLKITAYFIILTTRVKSVRGGFACLESPCFHGICIDYLDTNRSDTFWLNEDEALVDDDYRCYCRNGFTGYSCQINWDECSSNPCQNGGECLDGIASFNCSCPDNFTGALCQYDLSACDCLNNGTCTIVDDSTSANLTGVLACSCPAGFSGSKCELDISVCNTTVNGVCLNGGQCLDGVGESFHCNCEPGWEGRICERQIDNCSSEPCLNGAICVNKINDFGCACPFGYTGKTCEKKLKICEVNPCKNGAFCLHEDEDESPEKITCYCVPDYYGLTCEFKYDECSPGPKCFNGGTCIDGVGGFSCSCPPNISGIFCHCTLENMTDPSCGNATTFVSASEIIYPQPSTPSFSLGLSTQFPGQSELTSVIEGTSSLFLSTEPVSDHYSAIDSSIQLLDSAKSFLTSTIITPSLQTLSAFTVEYSISLEGSEGSITPSSFMSLFPTPRVTPSISEPDLTETILSSSEDIMSVGVVSSSTYQSVTQVHSASDFVLSSSVRVDEIKPSEESIPSPTPTTNDEIEESSIRTTSQTSYFPSVLLLTTATALEPGSLTSSISDSVLLTTRTLPSSTNVISSEEISEPTISYEFSTVELESAMYSSDSILSLPLASSLLSTTHQTHLPEQTVLSPTLSQAFPFTTVFPDTTIGQYSSSTLEISEEWSTHLIISTTASTSHTMSLPPDTAIIDHSQSDYEALLNSSSTTLPISIETSTILIDYSSSQAFISESLSDVLFETGSIPLSLSSSYFPQTTVTTIMPTTSVSSDPEVSSSFYHLTTTPYSTTTTTPPSITNDSHTDPCQNFCLNNGICKSDSIEPSCTCTFKFSGSRCEKPRKRFETVSFTGDSFLGYTVPNDSINKITVKTTLATNVPDGILFFKSSSLGRLYALIFTQGGHISLHFSCGAQSMHFVETRTRIDNGYNFTLEFSLEMLLQQSLTTDEIHCVGQVSVNHSYVMRGEQIVGQNELYENPIQFIYVGGVDTTTGYDARKSDDLIGIMPGFKGCLYNLMINDETKDLFEDAVDGKEVAECSAFGCVTNPCFDGSKCVPWNKFPFWQCICSPGFQGVRCHIRVCDSNPCQNGATCTFLLEESNESSNSTEITSHHPKHCLCPLGYTGSQCQTFLNVTKPSFKPIGSDYSAFIAYEPIPRFADWVQLKFHFVIYNTSQIALLLYSGYTQSLSTSAISNPDDLDALTEILKDGSTSTRDAELLATDSNSNNEIGTQRVSDFFAITYVNGYIALTWNLGSGTQRIITPSRIEKRLNVHTLFAGKSGRQCWLKVDGMRNVTGKSPGPFHRLNVNTELFLGGYDAFRFEGLPHDLPLHKGFEGCILDFGVRVKNRLYLPKAIRGRNIKNCYEEDC